jgi:DNA-binding NarL/FixJ family response regulator
MLKPRPHTRMLTQEEFNIAFLKAQGRSRGEIASRQKMSQSQVGDRITVIHKKLKVKDTFELTRLLEKEGVL